ncbi:hypothetical protein R1flu_024694 [Riccia fluitans]|uniref:J domain-containing protein n=1 Tax=Riccia fluitans TaxID=41844 RepID=A0ABD1XVS4_9MARC
MSRINNTETVRCTLYQILQVSEHASTEEIRRAYRQAVLMHHPDKGGDHDTFRIIVDAYHVLSDPIRRKHYDDTQKRNSSSGSSVRVTHGSQKATERKDFTSSGFSARVIQASEKPKERKEENLKSSTSRGSFRPDVFDIFHSDYQRRTLTPKRGSRSSVDLSKMETTVDQSERMNAFKTVHESKTVKAFEKLFFQHFERI